MANYIVVDVVNPGEPATEGRRLIPIDNITTIISTSTTITTINYSANISVGADVMVVESYTGSGAVELRSLAITHAATTQPDFVTLVMNAIIFSSTPTNGIGLIDTTTYAVSAIDFTSS